MMTRETIITIESTTMVNLGADGKPTAHGKTEITKNRVCKKPNCFTFLIK
jgi:hypothetical protein